MFKMRLTYRRRSLLIKILVLAPVVWLLSIVVLYSSDSKTSSADSAHDVHDGANIGGLHLNNVNVDNSGGSGGAVKPIPRVRINSDLLIQFIIK